MKVVYIEKSEYRYASVNDIDNFILSFDGKDVFVHKVSSRVKDGIEDKILLGYPGYTIRRGDKVAKWAVVSDDYENAVYSLDKFPELDNLLAS